MRVAVISHTYVVAANRGKLRSLARLPGLEVMLVAPRTWRNRDIGQHFHAAAEETGPLAMALLSAWSFGSGSLITYSPAPLWRVLRNWRPDVVHLEEEPWSLAALEVSLICRFLGIPLSFFTWENSDRPLLLPFRLIKRLVLRCAAAGIAGNAEAKELLGKQGFTKSIEVLPQLGVDVIRFQPRARTVRQERTLVGFVGRLVPQKGILLLLEAIAQLPEHVELMIVGTGPLRERLLREAERLRVGGRLCIHEGVAHHDIPQYLRQMSLLVLPSLTTPRWKEQFGHVLIEAMACGVPVIGSDSGAIREVVGDAGVIVQEGNSEALATAIRLLVNSPNQLAELAARGRARALAEYSNESLAQRLASFVRKAPQEMG